MENRYKSRNKYKLFYFFQFAFFLTAPRCSSLSFLVQTASSQWQIWAAEELHCKEFGQIVRQKGSDPQIWNIILNRRHSKKPKKRVCLRQNVLLRKRQPRKEQKEREDREWSFAALPFITGLLWSNKWEPRVTEMIFLSPAHICVLMCTVLTC